MQVANAINGVIEDEERVSWGLDDGIAIDWIQEVKNKKGERPPLASGSDGVQQIIMYKHRVFPEIRDFCGVRSECFTRL